MSLFKFQAKHCPVYRDYVQFLGVDPAGVSSIDQIPFLPISFFKKALLKTGDWKEEAVFFSSGTTGERSRHAVKDIDFYKRNSQLAFEEFFGPPERYHFFALLPGYLGREGSSLIVMMNHLIQASRSGVSGFYLDQLEQLVGDVSRAIDSGRIPVIWGTTYALLDLAENHHPDLDRCLIVETGGMKGNRTELTRQELHDTLSKGFGVKTVYSEYGMTELMSQAYSGMRGTFLFPPWARVRVRDIYDPFTHGLIEQTGALNIIDLANWSTIAFIETEDLGKSFPDHSFEVLGRMDNSDIRGCNLLTG